MTTIAYSKGILASDSKLTTGSMYWANCIKIKRVKDWLIGASGGWDLSEAFMKRFDPVVVKAGLIAMPTTKENDFEGLMVSPEGKIYYTEASGSIAPLKTKGFIALGSGAKIAMIAMEMGATAIEAVKMAIKYDIYTGGRIQSLKLRR